MVRTVDHTPSFHNLPGLYTGTKYHFLTGAQVSILFWSKSLYSIAYSAGIETNHDLLIVRLMLYAYATITSPHVNNIYEICIQTDT